MNKGRFVSVVDFLAKEFFARKSTILMIETENEPDFHIRFERDYDEAIANLPKAWQ